MFNAIRPLPPVHGYDPVAFTAPCPNCGGLVVWRTYMVMVPTGTHAPDYCIDCPCSPCPCGRHQC